MRREKAVGSHDTTDCSGGTISSGEEGQVCLQISGEKLLQSDVILKSLLLNQGYKMLAMHILSARC